MVRQAIQLCCFPFLEENNIIDKMGDRSEIKQSLKKIIKVTFHSLTSNAKLVTTFLTIFLDSNIIQYLVLKLKLFTFVKKDAILV